MALHLTDRNIPQLPAPARGNKLTYDTETRGFAVRVTAGGGRAFILNYRRKVDGRERRFTIGAFPDWKTTAARDYAKKLKRQIDGGADPVGELQEARGAATVRDLAERFLADYVPRRRVSTQRDYIRQIAKNILPDLGNLKVDAVTFADVDRLHRVMSKRAPTQANRTIAVLSRMFTLAKRLGMRTGDNPVKGIERNQEHRRQRYLTPAELIRLASALNELRDQGAANAIRLMLLTGARRGETLQAKWSDFDLPGKVWTKPGATTKQKTTHRIPLSDAAVALLKDMQELAPLKLVYLFPPPEGLTEYRLDLDDAWAILRKTADIADARLHDVRHTYASVLVSAGQSLPIIGALLGHSTSITTSRYAHLFDDPLRVATEQASAILTGAKSAEVVAMPDRRRG